MPTDSYVGQVKWFNTKTGFGFITVRSDGDYTGKDIFVHHSDLKVAEDQYRYLVMGEYVEFSLMETDDEHQVKATTVSGILGGSLMCQVRNENQRTGERRQVGGRRRQGQRRLSQDPSQEEE
tara:strand:+ start:244 stop:609 length:366 start_codon:yes stop_codon:yes gene_type:complete